MARLAEDVADLQRSSVFFIELDESLVRVQLQSDQDALRIDLFVCDPDAYPNAPITVICSENEDCAAQCTSQLQELGCADLRTALLVVCGAFGCSTDWADGPNVLPAAPPELIRDISTMSAKSTFSVEAYERSSTCVDAEQRSSSASARDTPLSCTNSCTLRGLVAELVAKDHRKDWSVSDTDQVPDKNQSGEGSSSEALTSDKLNHYLLQMLLCQACEKLAALELKQRPSKVSALISLLQRVTGCKGGVKAFILDPVEVFEVLLCNGTLKFLSVVDREKINSLLMQCRPSLGNMMHIIDHPSNQTRIVTQAKRAKFDQMTARETAEWILAQAHVRMTFPASNLAEALMDKGCVAETVEGRLTYNLEDDSSVLKDASALKVFEERRLPDEDALPSPSRDIVFEPPERPQVKRKATGALSLTHRSKSSDVIGMLQAMFPDTSYADLHNVAQRCDWSVEQAVEALLRPTDRDKPNYPDDGELRLAKDFDLGLEAAKNSTLDPITIAANDNGGTLIAQGFTAMVGAIKGDSVDMAELTKELEAVNALGQQLGFLEFHIAQLAPRMENSTIELQREFDMLQRSREAVIAEKTAAERALAALRTVMLSDGDAEKLTSGCIAVEVKLNEKMSQSLRGVGTREASQNIANNLSHSGPWGHYAAYQFAAMLAREQELHGEFICFYHSYSYAALVYEVQTAIARGLFNLPDDFAPLPRLLMEPFNVCKNMQAMRKSCEDGGIDHDPAFQAVGLSLSCSLFAFESEAPPLSCFQTGYSAVSVSFRNLLVNLLGGNALAEDLADAAVKIGTDHGLPTYGYGHEAVGHDRTHLSGYMLQIFVHRSIVDQYAYPSEPYGVPIPGTCTQYVDGGGKADGQARLYFHPEIMLDATRTRLFHYCARPSQSSLDPHVPGSRGSLVRALQTALEPLFATEAARQATLRRLGLDSPK